MKISKEDLAAVHDGIEGIQNAIESYFGVSSVATPSTLHLCVGPLIGVGTDAAIAVTLTWEGPGTPTIDIAEG